MSLQSSFENIGAEPVTLQEVKDALRIDFSVDDSLIEMWITQARRTIETMTNRSLIEKRVSIYDDFEVCFPYELPYPRHDVVESIELNGEDITSDVDIEGLDTKVLRYNLPTNQTIITNEYRRNDSQTANRLKVVYTTKVDADLEGLKAIILKWICDYYEYRGRKFEGSLTMVTGISEMILPYKIVR